MPKNKLVKSHRPAKPAGIKKHGYDQKRLSASKRGYDHEWQKLRFQFLRANPLCVECGSEGEHVDHVKPFKDHPELRLDWSNLQTLCRSCHSRKTAKYDGGFGNTRTVRYE